MPDVREYDVRADEAIVRNLTDHRVVVTTPFFVDARSRPYGLGLEAHVAYIIISKFGGAEAARGIAREYARVVELLETAVGGRLPVVFAPGDYPAVIHWVQEPREPVTA